MNPARTILIKFILFRLLIVGALSAVLIYTLKSFGVNEDYILLAVVIMSILLILIDTASNIDAEFY